MIANIIIAEIRQHEREQRILAECNALDQAISEAHAFDESHRAFADDGEEPSDEDEELRRAAFEPGPSVTLLNYDFLAGCLCGSIVIPTLVRRISAGRGGAWSVLHQRVHAAALSYIREQAVLRGEDVRATCMEATLMLMLQAAGAAVSCHARRDWFVNEAGLAFDETVRLKELAKTKGLIT